MSIEQHTRRDDTDETSVPTDTSQDHQTLHGGHPDLDGQDDQEGEDNQAPIDFQDTQVGHQDLPDNADHQDTGEPVHPGLEQEAKAAELIRLSCLEPFDYAMERKQAAKSFGVPVSFLDAKIRSLVNQGAPGSEAPARMKGMPEDPEPWPEPVDTSELL
jgi:hypothetical protein